MTSNLHACGMPIAAVQGASRANIQHLLADFAAGLARDGFRVAGVVEVAEKAPTGACGRLALRELTTGRHFSISQNLGPGSTACNLDPGGLAAACAAVERSLGHGGDLVVISKFGKQEAANSGLADAFRAAAVAGVPILTAVNPAMSEAWTAFAGADSEILPAEREALEFWWKEYQECALSAAAE